MSGMSEPQALQAPPGRGQMQMSAACIALARGSWIWKTHLPPCLAIYIYTHYILTYINYTHCLPRLFQSHGASESLSTVVGFFLEAFSSLFSSFLSAFLLAFLLSFSGRVFHTAKLLTTNSQIPPKDNVQELRELWKGIWSRNLTQQIVMAQLNTRGSTQFPFLALCRILAQTSFIACVALALHLLCHLRETFSYHGILSWREKTQRKLSRLWKLPGVGLSPRKRTENSWTRWGQKIEVLKLMCLTSWLGWSQQRSQAQVRTSRTPCLANAVNPLC